MSLDISHCGKCLSSLVPRMTGIARTAIGMTSTSEWPATTGALPAWALFDLIIVHTAQRPQVREHVGTAGPPGHDVVDYGRMLPAARDDAGMAVEPKAGLPQAKPVSRPVVGVTHGSLQRTLTV